MKTDVCIDIKEFFEKTWTICIDEYELGSFDVFKMWIYNSVICVGFSICINTYTSIYHFKSGLIHISLCSTTKFLKSITIYGGCKYILRFYLLCRMKWEKSASLYITTFLDLHDRSWGIDAGWRCFPKKR